VRICLLCRGFEVSEKRPTSDLQDDRRAVGEDRRAVRDALKKPEVAATAFRRRLRSSPEAHVCRREPRTLQTHREPLKVRKLPRLPETRHTDDGPGDKGPIGQLALGVTGLVALRLVPVPPATLVRTIERPNMRPAAFRQRCALLAVQTHLVLAPEVAVVAELVAGRLPAELMELGKVPLGRVVAEVVGRPESVAVIVDVPGLQAIHAVAEEARKGVGVGGGDVECCLEEEDGECQVVEEHGCVGRFDVRIKYK